MCCSDSVNKTDAKYINSQLLLHVPLLQAVCGAALGSREQGGSDGNGSTSCQDQQLRECSRVLGSAFGAVPQLQRELMSNRSSHREGMKESVSKLILFAAETKLERKTLQLIELILAFYWTLAFCIFMTQTEWERWYAKIFFPKMRAVNMEDFSFYVFILLFVLFVLLSHIEDLLSIDFVAFLQISLLKSSSLGNNRQWILQTPFSEMAFKICGFLLEWH